MILIAGLIVIVVMIGIGIVISFSKSRKLKNEIRTVRSPLTDTSQEPESRYRSVTATLAQDEEKK